METPIVIYLNNGPFLIISILATIKAGCSFIPQDSSSSLGKINDIVKDSGAKYVITDQNLDIPHTRTIHINSVKKNMSNMPKEDCNVSISPKNSCYIIYTSGSTGKPKGVIIEHRNIVNYLLWAKDYYNVKKNRKVLLHSPVSFDLSLTSMLLPVISGGSVKILSRSNDINKLISNTEEHHSFIKVTPTHLIAISDLLSKDSFLNMTIPNLIIAGGELLTKSHIDKWVTRNETLTFVNEYGPTETTIGSTVFSFRNDREVSESIIPIGNPIKNTNIYLLDKDLNKVAFGEIGEIFIGGAGVGRGYVRNPKLTSVKFLPDISGNGGVMYKTGDRARYDQNQNLVFLGREDDQVKIRGYRIELGEVENALLKISEVANASVITRFNENYTYNSLVAFLEGENVKIESVRKSLASLLPQYMIPELMIKIDKIPTSKSGKVDRKMLENKLKKLDDKNQFVVSKKIVEDLFMELLNVEQVSLEDDFFEKGGHSLLAIQFIALLRERHNVEFPLIEILENSNVEHIIITLEKLLPNK